MKKSVFYLSSAITLLFWASVSAQEKPPLVPNNLAVAQDFLRTFYPDLNNKHYFLNVETSLYYDSQGSPFRGFWLKISNGSISDQGHQHNLAAGCSQGSVQAYQAPSGGFIGGECPPLFPQQFLSSAFQFDEAGHLESFNAQGEAASDPTAKAAFTKATANQKGLTGRDLVAALKRSGAKYVPDDKSDFVKNLPLPNLGSFLGKVELISVEPPIPSEDGSGFYADLQWVVKVKATRADNTTMTYRLEFEQFHGHLTALCELSSKAPCNIWRTPG